MTFEEYFAKKIKENAKLSNWVMVSGRAQRRWEYESDKKCAYPNHVRKMVDMYSFIRSDKAQEAYDEKNKPFVDQDGIRWDSRLQKSRIQLSEYLRSTYSPEIAAEIERATFEAYGSADLEVPNALAQTDATFSRLKASYWFDSEPSRQLFAKAYIVLGNQPEVERYFYAQSNFSTPDEVIARARQLVALAEQNGFSYIGEKEPIKDLNEFFTFLEDMQKAKPRQKIASEQLNWMGLAFVGPKENKVVYDARGMALSYDSAWNTYRYESGAEFCGYYSEERDGYTGVDGKGIFIKKDFDETTGRETITYVFGDGTPIPKDMLIELTGNAELYTKEILEYYSNSKIADLIAEGILIEEESLEDKETMDGVDIPMHNDDDEEESAKEADPTALGGYNDNGDEEDEGEEQGV